MTTPAVITTPDEVRVVLADPAFVVPPVPTGDSPGGIVWLRSTVSRFSDNGDHERRRSLVVDELATVDPIALGRAAFDRTADSLKSVYEPFDVMAKIARIVPVELLAEALSLPAGISEEVNIVAAPTTPVAIFRLRPIRPSPVS